MDDKVAVPNHVDLEITGDLTIAAWIKKDRTNDGRRWDAILAKSPGTWDYELLTSQDKSDEPAFFSKAGVPNEVYGSSPIPANSWHHVALTRSGNTVTFYLDGTAMSTVSMSGAFPTSGGGLQIGFDGSANNGMDGSIDEVQLYNRGLSAEEILAVMGTGNHKGGN